MAFASDITRVFSFKMGRDGSSRVYPDSGVKTGFHPASHHQDREDRILDFGKINSYHLSLLPYFLEKLKNTPDGDRSLLENTLVIYGSPMGNSNVHNHKRCPLFLAGHAGGKLKGHLHIKAADATPMANPCSRCCTCWASRTSRLRRLTEAMDLNSVGHGHVHWRLTDAGDASMAGCRTRCC